MLPSHDHDRSGVTYHPCALRSTRRKYAASHTAAKFFDATSPRDALTGANRALICAHASTKAAPYRSLDADAAVGEALGTLSVDVSET